VERQEEARLTETRTPFVVQFRDDPKWSSFRGTHVRGTAFLGDEMLDAPTLCRRFDACAGDAAKSCALLESLNGLFAVIHVHGDMLLAAVDIIRSIPIFYGEHAGGLFVSDDARWVRDQKKECVLNPEALREFGMLSCVTADQTLFAGVSQLQSGEMISFHVGPADLRKEGSFYFRHLHHDERPRDARRSIDALDEAVMAASSRLVAVAGGRTIVLPLSGGFDSRLVLIALKRLGYDHLLAFTYGRPGNTDSTISKRVAAAAGVPWRFIPYSTGMWRSWYSSDERRQHFRFADGLTALPAYSNMPALSELLRDGFIPRDAVLVPGIAADLPAGSYSVACPSFYLDGGVDVDRVARTTARLLYSLRPLSTEDLDFAVRRVSRTLLRREEYADNADVFEEWFTREKVAKFVVNAVRNYEFSGLSWWLPFFDRSFIEFWLSTPRSERLWQGLYDEYLKRWSQQILGFHVPSPKTGFKSGVLGALKEAMMGTALARGHEAAKVHRAAARADRVYSAGQQLALYGTVPEEEFRSGYSGREGPYSFNVASYLHEIAAEVKS
jgi:asparagine synthase (glutamine-hydrolysing)